VAAAETSQPTGAYRALTLGVSQFREPYPALSYATELARELRGELVGLGYAAPEQAPAELTSEVLGQTVRDTLRAAGSGDVLIVHLVTHGGRGATSDKLYAVGADGEPSDLAIVENWLVTAEDGADRPLVLFLLDVCESGAAARLPWQDKTADGAGRAWVIAACAPWEQAFNGRLTQATITVLRRLRSGDLDIDAGVEFVPLRTVGREIRAEVARLTRAEGKALRQQVTGTRLDFMADPPELPFFKNPGYSSNPLFALRGREESAIAAFADGIGEPATRSIAPAAWAQGIAGLPDDPDLSSHFFADRTRGHGLIAAAPDAGCFSGRTEQLSELVPWLQSTQWAPGPQPRTLSVVTGGPGAGKSALIGVLVCAAHPKLRDATAPLWSKAANAPGCISHLVAVHARQRDLADVGACLARQLAPILRPGSAQAPADMAAPAALVAAISSAASSAPVPVIVLDALDEAVGGREIVTRLLLPLAAARRPDGTPACRLLVGSRRYGFEDLLEAARTQGGLVDLDKTDRTTLAHDLGGYVAKLLQTQPGYQDKTPISGTFGYAVAHSLASQRPDADRSWGEFLVAGLYTHSVLRDTAAAPFSDYAEAARRGAECPHTLPEVLDLDLKGRPNQRDLMQVLQIAALARGAGMPASVIDRCRPRKPKFGPYTATLSALAELGFYLRRANDEDGTTLYRVFHEGLADHLRPPQDARQDTPQDTPLGEDEVLIRVWNTAWEPAWSKRTAEAALVQGMLSALGDDPAARRWDLAEPYVLRHVLDHALDGGLTAIPVDTGFSTGPDLDSLLLDAEFLVHADAATLNVLARMRGGAAARVRRCLYLAQPKPEAGGKIDIPADPSARRAALALAAARLSDPLLATAFAEPPEGSPELPLPWQPRWSAGTHLAEADMTYSRFSETVRTYPGTKRGGGTAPVISGPFWPELYTYTSPRDPIAAIAVGEVDSDRAVILGTIGKRVEVRALRDGGLMTAFDTGFSIRAVGVSQAALVAVVQADGTVRTIDIPTAHAALAQHRLGQIDVVSVEVTSVAGRPVLGLRLADGSVDLFNLRSAPEEHMPAHEPTDLRCADGRQFALVHKRATYDITVTTPEGAQHGVLTGHTRRITTLTTMTLDGQPVAVTASFDGSVRFWDVPSLREIERLTLPGPVQWVASAGDDHLAVLCSGEAIIYARHK
jgi:hypothetical protein